jgi:hypothetical protein
MDADAARRLAELLKETGHEHHEAYIQTDGEDAEWPLWYAGYLQERVPGILGKPVTKSQLVYLLVAAERARAATGTADWPAFYAEFMLTHEG